LFKKKEEEKICLNLANRNAIRLNFLHIRSYTSSIASKIFNHRKTLQHLIIDDLCLTPPVCSCSSSPFNYNPIRHVITGK